MFTVRRTCKTCGRTFKVNRTADDRTAGRPIPEICGDCFAANFKRLASARVKP